MPMAVTGPDEEAIANMTKNVSHEVPRSPTLPTPIRVSHRNPRSQTEKSELLAGPNENQDSMREEVDAISLLQEASLCASSLSYDDIIDTREFQEDLFQGLPARRTRATTRKLEKIANAESPSPTKNPDDAEGSGDSFDDDTYTYEAPVMRKEDFVDKEDTSCSDTCMDLSVSKTRSSRKPTHPAATSISQDSPSHEAEKRQAWKDWVKRKAETNGLLATPKYGMPSSHGHEYESIQLPPLTELENHGIYSVEQRVCVLNFKYNDLAFSDFARKFPLYLELLEEAAGRDCGVVKVILPHLSGETRRPTEVLNSGQLLCTQHSKSAQNVASHGEVVTYVVKSKEQKNVEYSSGIQFPAPDSVKNGFDFDCEEREFLTRVQAAQSASTSTMRTANKFNMARVRSALGLNTVELSILPKDTPKESLSTVSSTDEVQIDVAKSEGFVCGMRMNKSAGYSISYLHKGAAKVWTVVKPFEHAKLEEIMHIMTSPNLVETEKGPRPHFPPQCDQFLGHKNLYVPGHTLEALGVVYRQVVQEQNEMIIVFPYAYCQAYDTGANISEEMPYSTKRSDNLLTGDLYRQCGPICSINSLHVQLTSVQEGHGSLVRRRQLARKGGALENTTRRQHDNSGKISKRKLDDGDTVSISKPSGPSAKKKKTLTRSLTRESDGVSEVLEKVDQEFADGYGKNVKRPGRFT
ncbi:hypothetical protein MMC27_004189 [Xylographa pallens]|nr:hypothetical protein [Xylographa pallens]